MKLECFGLHEKSRNGEIGTLTLCWNSVTTQSLHSSLLWCLVGHSSWPRNGGHSLIWDVLSGLSSCRILMLQRCVVLVCSLVTVCNNHSAANELLIYHPFPCFPQGIYLLLPAFSDNFTSIYFKVILLMPFHHYKRCHKSEVMDLYYLLYFQLLVFKVVNLIFCLPSSPCDHKIAI